MLDDSASDNSSTLQTPGMPNPSLPPASPSVGDRPQDRGPKPNLGPENAKLQQMLSISDEAEIDMQDMQMVGLESKQQQTSEVSNQLQVSVTIMTETQPPASPCSGQSHSQEAVLHGTHIHNLADTVLGQHMTCTWTTQG